VANFETSVADPDRMNGPEFLDVQAIMSPSISGVFQTNTS